MKSLVVMAIFLCATVSFAGVVQPIGAASQVLIPAAGSTQGANGAFFRSDISIINLASRDQMIVLQWLPQQGTTTNTLITIPARTGFRSADFVHDYLNQSGLGAIIINAVTSTSAPDPSALLYVNSRIWSLQPGTNGTTSQSFPAIPLGTINTPAAALFAVGGPENPGNYRVNVGIVNIDPSNAQTFVVLIQNVPFQSVTVAPMSTQQIALGSGLAGSTQVSIQNTTATATRSNLWTAYASTVDNITADAWSELAVAGSAP